MLAPRVRGIASSMIDALVVHVFVEQSKWPDSMDRARRASYDGGKYGEQGNRQDRVALPASTAAPLGSPSHHDVRVKRQG
jgi:hypothetical protein